MRVAVTLCRPNLILYLAIIIFGGAAAHNNDYWATGGSTGVAYFGTGTAATVSSTVTNCRAVAVQNGQLYFSTGSGTTRGVYKVGTGMPVASGTTSTNVISMGSAASPFGFAFNAAGTICYVADDLTTAAGGIYKFTFNGTNWVQAYILGTGVANIGARGLCVDFSGSNPVIYATTAEATANRLIKITDAGASSTATTLATAATNTIFRGLAFAPTILVLRPSLAA